MSSNNKKVSVRPPELTVEPSAPPEPIALVPFPDGTVLKYKSREPAIGDQQVLVNFRGDVLAIAKDTNCAVLISDGVNIMFAALTKKQELEDEILARSTTNITKEKQPK